MASFQPSAAPSQASSSSLLIASITSFAQTWLSLPIYDASHSWAHTHRVLSLSQHLHRIESARNAHPLNPTLITLAALLHDVADRKYFSSIISQPQIISDLLPTLDLSPGTPNAETIAAVVLQQHGASSELATAVQEIINGLSFSTENSNPEVTRTTLERYPELGIVQDADRLDALGAVGIARAFTYGGAVEGRSREERLRGWAEGEGGGVWLEGGCEAGLSTGTGNEEGSKARGLDGTLRHFEEKLERLEGLMKTEEGRRLARVRTERLRVFRGWWAEEVALAGGGDGSAREAV